MTLKLTSNTASSVKAMVRNPYIKSPHDRLVTLSSPGHAWGVDIKMDVRVLLRDKDDCIAFLGVLLLCSFKLHLFPKYVTYVRDKGRPSK